MKGRKIRKDFVVPLLDTKFIKVFDLEYEKDRHYYDATRRNVADLVATKTDQELKEAFPDAVSCVVVLVDESGKERLCVMQEYRYPIGRFVLSVPSGLIDDKDKEQENPLYSAAIREVAEETGLAFDEVIDEIKTVNPMLFCSPGMTDESTAVVKIVMHRKKIPEISKDGAVGTELFKNGAWITKDEAITYLKKGSDETGIFYSAITWIALNVFISDLW